MTKINYLWEFVQNRFQLFRRTDILGYLIFFFSWWHIRIACAFECKRVYETGFFQQWAEERNSPYHIAVKSIDTIDFGQWKSAWKWKMYDLFTVEISLYK